MKDNATNTAIGKKKLSSLIKSYSEAVFPFAAFFSALFFTAYYLIGPMVPDETLERISLLYRLAVACHLLMLPGILLGKKQFGQLMLLANLVWLVVSRLILRDRVFRMDSACQWALVFCCFYGCTRLMEGKKRDMLLRLVTVEMLAVLSVWAAAGILTAIRGSSLPGFEQITLKTEYHWSGVIQLIALKFYGIHRNKAAAFFVSAAGLCLYHCVKDRSLFWKLCAAVFLPLGYCTVALLHSRSNYLAFALMLSLTAVPLLWDRLGWLRRPAGIAGEVFTAALCTVIIFSSFDLCSSAVVRLSARMRTDLPQQTEAAPVSAPAVEALAQNDPAVPEDTEDTEAPESVEDTGAAATVTDLRDTLQDAKTLTGRLTLWKALLRSIREHPKIGLVGQREKTMMKVVREKTFPTAAHMHNILFQQLGLTGFPGLALYILWLLYLAHKMFVCFFLRKDNGARSLWVICAVMLGLLAYGMMEPLLSFKQPITSILFCLMAGLLSDVPASEQAES